MRLAFLGTPEVAADTLRAVVGAGHEVSLVVTRKDARRGRGGDLSPSPVKAAAAELGLPVAYSAGEVPPSGAELGVVVAYGRIIKPEVLAEVPMVNLHFSLLPRWRGAAPVERAVLAGDAETGACVMQLEEGLDTGPVFGCQKVAIGAEETAGELRRRLGVVGTKMLLEMLSDGFPTPAPQVGEPTYAAKVEASELHLDFSRSAEQCLRVIRVGKAWTNWRGKRLIVHRARPAQMKVPCHPELGHPELGHSKPGEIFGDIVATGDGCLELLVVQPEGKPPMPAKEWLRGARAKPGEQLGA